MKIMLLLLSIGAMALSFPAVSPADAAQAAGKKILIAYFSRSGNTAEIARQVQRQVGGDLFEIRAVTPYPDDYRKCTEAAKVEQEKNARPALAAQVPNMQDYDVVFIGHPIWWGTMPMAVFTFLESYDVAGKTVVPFCTHEGSGRARSVDDLKRLAPKSTVAEGFAVRGSGATASQNEVSAWLGKLGL